MPYLSLLSVYSMDCRERILTSIWITLAQTNSIKRVGAFLTSVCDSNGRDIALRFSSPSLSSNATRLAIASKRKYTALKAMPKSGLYGVCSGFERNDSRTHLLRLGCVSSVVAIISLKVYGATCSERGSRF